MLNRFNKKKYKIIKNAIPKSMASFLTDYFFLKHQVVAKLFLDGFITRDRVEWGSWVDTQNQSTYSCYADMTTETLLLRLHPLIEKHSGHKLIPTYSYMRIYKKGDALETHIDRPECEVSATLNLAGGKGPSFFKEGDKKAFSISFTPGDMAIYKGCELQHWREPFEGEYCVQVFLHYTNETNTHLRFDTREMPGLPCAYKQTDGWFKHSQLNMDILRGKDKDKDKDK